jgi:hypothetical protein
MDQYFFHFQILIQILIQLLDSYFIDFAEDSLLNKKNTAIKIDIIFMIEYLQDRLNIL